MGHQQRLRVVVELRIVIAGLALSCFLVADATLAPCVKCHGQRMRCEIHERAECVGECRHRRGTTFTTPNPPVRGNEGRGIE